MKAVIVEIRENKAAALSEDGRIIKIRNKKYAIGQEILVSQSNKYIKWAASAAAAFMLFATPAWAYLTPYSYVSVDVNPSVEFSLNRFDRVLSIKAVNDDGDEFLKDIDLGDLKNKDIKEAVVNLLTEIKDSGYLAEGEESGVVVAASSKTKEKTEELSSKIKTTLEKNNDYDVDIDDEDIEDNIDKEESNDSKIEIEVVSVGKERVEEAKALGTTPGKLNLVQKLQKSAGNPEDFDAEEWLNKPVKEIMQATKEYKKAAKSEQLYDNVDLAEADGKEKNKETENPKNIKSNSKSDKNNNVDNNKNNNNSNNGYKPNDGTLKNIQGIIESVDKKNNSIDIKTEDKKVTVYINENTKLVDEKGKDININNLKANETVKLELNYVDDKYQAKELKVLEFSDINEAENNNKGNKPDNEKLNQNNGNGNNGKNNSGNNGNKN